MNIFDSQVVFAFIEKPAGITSHDVIAQLRKTFPSLKAGHGGTLDPFATGILPVFFGSWTKLSSLFSFADKRYKAQLELGSSTDTGDFTGQVTQKKNIPLYTDFQLNMLQRKMQGHIDLPIPIYSALKIDGTPMYELARKGALKESNRMRKTYLYHVSLLPGPKGHQILLDVTCSHGTYIRSLGEYVAKKLQTVGHLSKLERVSYGSEQTQYSFPSLPLEDFKKDPSSALVTLSDLKRILPVYSVSAPTYRDLRLGRQKFLPFRVDGWAIIQYEDHIVAVVFAEKGRIMQRLFPPVAFFQAEKSNETESPSSFKGIRLSALEH